MGYQGMKEDERLVAVLPSPRQIAYQSMEFIGFIHFGMNTFTGREWGTGKEDPAIFNPVDLDARQWVKTFVDAGIRGLILTCKHHDGFCLWPSRHTSHCISSSPYKDGKGDIVKEVAQACKEFGIKFGVYLSPWDMNSEFYGQGEVYDDFYIRQLEELLTGYGEIFSIWLDGACGEGRNGKVQKYDWHRYFDVMRKLQPHAVISICGPDVRWCGNEAGKVRACEWSVVPAHMADPVLTAELSQQEDSEEFRNRPVKQEDLGSRQKLADVKDLVFYPSETDTSIRPGWFYHTEDDDKVRTLDNLKFLYFTTVGGNSSLLLNVPPMPNGLIHQNDMDVLKSLGDFLTDTFKYNLANTATICALPQIAANGYSPHVLLYDSYDEIFINTPGEKDLRIVFTWEDNIEVNYLVIKEAITHSQRIESFGIFSIDENGKEISVYDGKVIGYKKIIPLHGLRTKSLTIQITDVRVAPALSFIGVY